jgi:hypothetical protein
MRITAACMLLLSSHVKSSLSRSFSRVLRMSSSVAEVAGGGHLAVHVRGKLTEGSGEAFCTESLKNGTFLEP